MRRLLLLLGVLLLLHVDAAFGAQLANCKEKAYTASTKSDPRNLITAQEAYFADHGNQYAPRTSALDTLYRPSQGMVVEMVHVSATGWRARAAGS